MSGLFSPIQIRGLRFKNRLGMSPMCMHSCEGDGVPSVWHQVHLGARAIGGCGLIMTEATAVEARGRISDEDTGIWNDQQTQAWRAVAHVTRELSCPLGIQLAHAGRKSTAGAAFDGTDPCIAPSPLAFSKNAPTPRPMSEADLRECLTSWTEAAVRTVESGSSFLELHMAHGYLLGEFLSPITNKREDLYGGSFENRIRFPLEVVRRVRGVIPDAMPVFVRISSTDHVEGGWTLEDSVSFARMLKAEGVDVIDCSSGGISPEAAPPVPLRAEQGYQVDYARTIKREADILTAAVGGIVDSRFAEQLVQTESCDFVFLGRQLLRNPNWGLKAAKELEGDSKLCPQYERAFI